MRIAQVANFVGPTSGGMRTAVNALGRGYLAAGAQRLLVVPGPRDRRSEGPEGTVIEVRAPKVGGGYRLIVEPWRVIEVLVEFAPTSIELNDKLTLLPVARWARKRAVGTVLFSHERLDDMFALRTGVESGTRVSVALLNRILVRSVDRVVVASDYAAAEFRTAAAAVQCPITRVPLGVDLDRFVPTAWHPDPVLRLIHVGRLSREKSPQLAVGAAVELHRRGVPLRLDVYGDGPQRGELEAIADGAPVTFHGHVPGRLDLATRIAQADIALSPCPGETFGLAVLEALACGVPVVTSDRGGARELVDSRCGAWGAPDPAALADAVQQLAAADLSAARAAARRQAERFDWAETVAGMLAVHSELRAEAAS